MAYELAQLNIAEPLGPMDGELMRGFADLLLPVNALADAAPGFVWRLQTDEGDATALRAFDGSVMVNMSTWTSVDALADFVFGELHAAVMRRRRQWFALMRDPYTCLWWVPAGHRPSVEEAEERLLLLRGAGPSPTAFTLRRPFARPDGVPVSPRADLCPA